MKSYIFLIYLLLLNISLYASNDFTINARFYRYNVNTQLDKLIIINNSTGVRIETKGNVIKKDYITEVEDNNDESFSLTVNKIDENNFIIKCPNQYDVNLKLYDYSGNLIISENVNDKFNFKLNTKGIYFIVACNGKETINKIINTYNLESIYVSNAVPIKKPNNLYTFIGIKTQIDDMTIRDFIPDTIYNVNIDTCSVLNFLIYENTKFKYLKNGTLNIKGLNLKRTTLESIRSINTTKTQTQNNIYSKDTTITFKSNSNEYYVSPLAMNIGGIRPTFCYDYPFNDTLLTFCHANIKTWDNPPFYNQGFDILLNNIFFEIKDSLITKIRLEVSLDSQHPQGSIYGSRSSQKENIIISNLNLNLINSNKFIFKVSKDIYYSFVYSSDTSYSHWDGSSTDIKEYLNSNDNEVEIELEFNN